MTTAATMAAADHSNKIKWLAGLLALLIGGAVWAANEFAFQLSRADLWRMVREGVAGYSAVKGQETGELIQASGEIWRRWRNGPLFSGGAIALGATLALLALFYLLRGQVKLEKPRTGIKIPRWNLGERVLHWFVAVLFILLTVTGLTLLYGKAVLLPWLGKAQFAHWAQWAKWLHNLSGPLFIAGLVPMILIWFKDNLWRPGIDGAWFKALGGLVGRAHPPAGRMNAGEKGWFWLLMTVGGVLSVTGLLLDLPLFGLERESMQIAHLLHVVSAFLVIVGALGHIYIGTIGTEGALEGMITGEVDLSWARQHHDLWLEELEKAGKFTLLKGETEIQRPASFFKPET